MQLTLNDPCHEKRSSRLCRHDCHVGFLVFITVKTIARTTGLTSVCVESELEVLFDDLGVPHIYAQSETDAMHALGYVQAMERLWQMICWPCRGGGVVCAAWAGHGGERQIPSDAGHAGSGDPHRGPNGRASQSASWPP